MFRKLISNLPFNPSLLDTVSFYARRVKQEESLRRIGFGFMGLAMFIQVFAVMAPPEPTLAASDNDIIRGGFQDKLGATLMCLDATRSQGVDFANILKHYGFTCTDVDNATQVNLRSTSIINGKELYSMGRHARGPIGRSNKPTDERAVHISGKTYYMRRLASLDTWAHSTYKALRLQNSQGKVMYVINDCANPVLIGVPDPPLPPQVTDNGKCEVISSIGVLNPREKFTATIRLNNTGGTSWDPGKNYRLGSASPRDNINWGTNRVHLPRTINPGATVDVSATFTAPSTPGTYNFSWQMLQEQVRWFGASCSRPVTIKAPPAPQPPEIPRIPNPEPPQPDACPDIPGIQNNASECAPCEESLDENDIASCLQTAKQATNNTQGIADANETTAAAGDEITYILTVANSGNRELKNFVFTEELGDVLEYADLEEIGGAKFDEEKKTLTWPAVTIGAGTTEQRSFTVKVKDPVPQTPVSASDPTSYDLTMTNVFHGASIRIHLRPGIAKTTEQVVTTLPNTGPGTSLAIGFVITTVIAYFFARSKILADELDIIRTDFAQTGGL